jgi:hypothetical protein
VAKFAEFQHYRQRNPPWIKLHTALLDEERYIALPDAQKAALMGLFLQAARSNNKIMNDARWLQGKLGMKVKPDLEMLAARKWLVPYHDASDPVEVNRQRGSSKTLASGASKALARDARDAQDTQETNKKTNKTPTCNTQNSDKKPTCNTQNSDKKPTCNTQNSDKTPTKPQYNASQALAPVASKTLASGRLPQSETETETETYIQDPPPRARAHDFGVRDGRLRKVEQIVAAWNVMAKESGLAQVLECVGQRSAPVLARLVDQPEIEWWLEAIRGAPLLRNARFSPDFDWFFRSKSNALQALEAKTKRPDPRHHGDPGKPTLEENLAAKSAMVKHILGDGERDGK